MHHLRHLLVLRLGVLSLLLGLGVGAVPAALAVDADALAGHLYLADLQVAEVSEGADASGPSAQPTSPLEDVRARLIRHLGSEAEADALLRALYGQLLRIYRYDLSQDGLVIPTPTVSNTAEASDIPIRPAATEASTNPVLAAVPTTGVQVPPRARHPAVQPLGP